MIGRVKSNQAQRLKEDRISQLPDPLICQILTHLPTKDSVKTSVLSKRWKSLWLWVNSLDLAPWQFPDLDAFVSFSHRFFYSNRVSCIHKFKLSIDENEEGADDASYLTSWMDTLVNRKIQHLDVQCPPDEYLHEIPRSLYISETLVSLKLFEVTLADAEFVSLPCLKTMHLKNIWYPNEATFQKFVSCCPVLEELKIVECSGPRGVPKVCRVHSLSLKRLKIKLRFLLGDDKFGVVIDAPLLCCLRIVDNVSKSYVRNNLASNAKLDIALCFRVGLPDEPSFSSKRDSIRDFLYGISKVGEMIIHLDTFKAFINLNDMCYEQMNQISFSSVPECLLSSLEFVDIKSTSLGQVAEMKLVRYFLENSVFLKKLTLRLNYCANEDVISKKLVKIPRRSITCEVVVLKDSSENM